ncbi:FecCD family ABC transporter permease [Bosea robiniae]|uniref:Iron complex transport system permease protein n=1 Tax=Bosea robiniae TaxID=1036780 RepID=A0ABY0P6E6_9HYPH|nr:iron ABC transporter permease [Bosea robiniae]SDH50334.1 iron complex transport system permease protein [Bosea robiniae]
MTRTPLAIVIGALVLLAASLIALTLGARPIAAGEWLAILHEGRGNEAAEIVLGLRLPRVLLGAMVGAALGLAGAVIQLATRNPLGDPGLLGINAGASLALILGTDLIGLAGPQAATWLAACGALGAVLAVQALAGARSSSNPIRLTLAGVAITALCIGIGQAVALSDPERFDLVRNWRVGALSGATGAILPSVTLAWLVGTLLTLALAPRLDLLALGDDRAASLGVAVRPVRLGSLIAVVLLAGSAVAAAGPIAFIGLASPHIARRLGGIGAAAHLPLSGLIGAALVVIADTLGRIAMPPAEVPVGIVAGLLGAPILILLARRRNAAA